MKITRRICLLLLTVLSVTGALSLSASAEEPLPDVSGADHYYLYNLENDRVLYSAGVGDKIYPGPTAKLMTALLAVETFYPHLETTVTVTGLMLYDKRGTRAGLKVGEEVAVQDLLGALLVGGANDAAGALAVAVAERNGMTNGVDDFVILMNRRAVELGATHTNYTNPSGLDNTEMFTTVGDIAIIAKQLMQYSFLPEITSKVIYTVPATNLSKQRELDNKNYLISTAIEYQYRSPSVDGLLAGNTPKAGYCVVSTSEKNGNRYLCIVMGAEKQDRNYYNYIVCRNLLNWAYENFAYQKVVRQTSIIAETPVRLSAGIDHVTLMPEHDVELYLNKSIDIASEIELIYTLDAPELEAPVQAGQKAGVLKIIYRGELLSTVNLVTKGAVERSESDFTWDTVTAIFNPKWVVPVAIACVIGAAVAGLRHLNGKQKDNYGD